VSLTRLKAAEKMVLNMLSANHQNLSEALLNCAKVLKSKLKMDKHGCGDELIKSTEELVSKGDWTAALPESLKAVGIVLHVSTEKIVDADFRPDQTIMDEVCRTAQWAKGIYKDEDNSIGQALALCVVADCFLIRREGKRGSLVAEKAADIFQKAGDKRMQAIALQTKANGLMIRALVCFKTYAAYVLCASRDTFLDQAKHDLELGLETVEQAVKIWDNLGEERFQADSLRRQAKFHALREESDLSKNAAREAGYIYQDLEDKDGELDTMMVLVQGAFRLDDPDEALQTAQDMMAIVEGSGSAWEAEVLLVIAKCNLQMSQPNRCRDHCNAATTILKSLPQEEAKENMATADVMQIRAYAMADDSVMDEALKFCEEALDSMKNMDYQPGLAQVMTASAGMKGEKMLRDMQKRHDNQEQPMYTAKPGELEDVLKQTDVAAQMFVDLEDRDGEEEAVELHNSILQRAEAFFEMTTKDLEPDVKTYVLDKNRKLIEIKKSWLPK